MVMLTDIFNVSASVDDEEDKYEPLVHLGSTPSVYKFLLIFSMLLTSTLEGKAR